MNWNTLSARDKSAFMNVALRHGVTDLAAIKRAYDSLGDGNVMAGGGPAKTKEPPISLAQRAAENRLRRANLFGDGGQEDVIDWSNVDLKAMRDEYQRSMDEQPMVYTAVPASRMSYNEGNGLWWDSGTGTWHSQDNLVFPGEDLAGATVVHNRNTDKDFVVPSDEYVRPLNTQDYFDHTGRNALEFASLMTSPTNLFMPSHIAGAIWDTYDKLSGKNPDVNLWNSWLHENQGIGRTNNPYLNLGLNLAGDMFGYGLPSLASSIRRVAPKAVLEAERAIGLGLYDTSKDFAKAKKLSQRVTDKLLPNLSGSGVYPWLARGAVKGFQSAVSSAADAVQGAFARPTLYLLSRYNKARDPIARKAMEEIFASKQDYLSRLARDYGYDYVPEMSPSEMAQYVPIDYSGLEYLGPHGAFNENAWGTTWYSGGHQDIPGRITINPVTVASFSDKGFGSLMRHEGTHFFDNAPSSKDLMYNIAAYEHPEFGVPAYQGAYKADPQFETIFKFLADFNHRAQGADFERYYPEEFSGKVRLVMPIEGLTKARSSGSFNDTERNAVLTEIRARFARKLGLDPMSPGFNETFANEVQALPDKRFLILNPGSKPKFTAFDNLKGENLESFYVRDWRDALEGRYNGLNDDASRQEFARNFIGTMKDLLINYRANGGRLNKFDGVNNLDRPNQMETAFDDLVAARDRYAQTGDINTSWEPVDLNDVSITDNGFITREGRVGDSFVLPEAMIIGQRPVVNEAILEEKPDDDSFLGRLRAARNRVKYGHSTLTEEDKAMIRRGNKVAAAGSAAIAAGVAAPYFAPYLASNVGTVLNAMQPSTYLDALASSLGAQVGNYGLGASTMAGALGNAALASDITAEGLGYLYNTYLNGDNPRSFGEDLNASLALAPFLAAPAAGVKKLVDLSRNSGRLMTRLEHANRLTRYLSAPRRARRYMNDYKKSVNELSNKSDDLTAENRRMWDLHHKVENLFGADKYMLKPVPQIDVSKASREDILKYLRKHNLPEDMFEFNEAGEPIVPTSGIPIFESGRIEVPVFGTGETKAFNITDVSHGAKKNLRTGEKIVIDGKQYNASELEDYYKLTRDNIEYVEKATGGKAFGSSVMVGFEEVPHATHDYDVLVTEEIADKKMSGWRDNFDGALAHYNLDKGKYGEIGNIDVNVILEGPDGKATGKRAMELFRQFFPEEYGKQAEAAMLKNLDEDAIKITKTPQELLDAYDPVTKTVMDALEIDYRQYRKDKHATRILGYLAYSQNPKSVAKGIDNFAKMLVGKDYRPAPKLNFSDREANIRFIDKMFGRAAGTFHGIADSPERMQSLFDMFYLGETTYVRELQSQPRPVSKAERDRVLNLWPNAEGNAKGKLVNAVKGNRSGAGNQIVVSQIPVELEDGTSISNAWKKISRATGHNSYTFTDEDLAADSRLGEYLGIDVGDDTSTALGKISRMPNDPITKADNVLRDPERFKAILNDPFYSHRRPTDQRASIASDILKDNEIYGLENGTYGLASNIIGPYISVVENLPYVSRQNLYWPSDMTFRSLRSRAENIRMSSVNPNVVRPMTVEGHKGKKRYINAGIAETQYQNTRVPLESPMDITRKRIVNKIEAINTERNKVREILFHQKSRLHGSTDLLGGKSLYRVKTELNRNRDAAAVNAIKTALFGIPTVAVASAVAPMAKRYAEEQSERIFKTMEGLYGKDVLNGLDASQVRRFYDEHKDEIDAEIKWAKYKQDEMWKPHSRSERNAAFGQALINLYGEDYYKNFSEDNSTADFIRFRDEHKDEINAEVNRIIQEQRKARLEKKRNKK